MDKKIEDLTKLYYSIGEVSDMFGVSKSLIRYWESEFSSLKPHKNSKGDRRFTKENIEQLKQIFHLVKERGFTIEGAKKEIRLNKSYYQKKKKIINKLESIRDQMEKLKSSL